MIWVAGLVCRIGWCSIGWCVVIRGTIRSVAFRRSVIDVGGSGISDGVIMDKSGLYEFDKTVVTSRLIRWGAWKMNSGVALGYPSMTTFMRMTPGATVGFIHDEVGSECSQTDKAVMSLSDIHKLVVRNEYVLHTDKKVSERADITGLSKRTYYDYLDCAHIQIAKRLNLLLISSHTSGINVLNVS